MSHDKDADSGWGDGQPRTIPEALHQAVESYRDDEALVDGTDRLSFGQLANRVEHVAGALVGSGIEPGDRVALWAPNSAEWVITSFAVYAVGAVLVPLNTRYRGEEAGHVLRTSRARLLFAVTDMLGSDLVELLADVPGLESLKEIVVLEGPARPGCTSVAEFRAQPPTRMVRKWTAAARTSVETTPPTSSSLLAPPANQKEPSLATVPVSAPTLPGPNWSGCAEAIATSWSTPSSTRLG